MRGTDRDDRGHEVDSLLECHFVYVIWRMSAVPPFVTFKCQIGVVKCDWTFQPSRRILRELESCKYMTRELNYK